MVEQPCAIAVPVEPGPKTVVDVLDVQTVVTVPVVPPVIAVMEQTVAFGVTVVRVEHDEVYVTGV